MKYEQHFVAVADKNTETRWLHDWNSFSIFLFFSSYINSWAYQPIEHDVFLKTKFSEIIFNLDLLNSISMPWNFLLILFIDKLNGHRKVVFFPKKKFDCSISNSILRAEVFLCPIISRVMLYIWSDCLIPNFQNSTVLKSFINTKYPFVPWFICVGTEKTQFVLGDFHCPF